MIPERNGISRLDEMMSGVVRVDMIIEWLIYCIRYNSYVLQIVDVARLSFRVELPARCCCAVFYSQLAPKVTRTRSVQTVVYLECHVVSFEYFRVIVQYNNRLYISNRIIICEFIFLSSSQKSQYYQLFLLITCLFLIF